jgi:hypothetical protein
MTLASPLILFHRGSYNNNSPGTFRYTSLVSEHYLLYDVNEEEGEGEEEEKEVKEEEEEEEEVVVVIVGAVYLTKCLIFHHKQVSQAL